MNFHFESRITPFDFWRMTMRKIYKSPMGICNIVFTVALFLLTFKIFEDSSDFVQLLLVIGCMMFTVFQPLAIYFKSKGQVLQIPADLKFDFDEKGIRVSTGNKSEELGWSKIKQVLRQPRMTILRMENNTGYFLTDRAMGKDKEAFLEFVQEKVGTIIS